MNCTALKVVSQLQSLELVDWIIQFDRNQLHWMSLKCISQPLHSLSWDAICVCTSVYSLQICSRNSWKTVDTYMWAVICPWWPSLHLNIFRSALTLISYTTKNLYKKRVTDQFPFIKPNVIQSKLWAKQPNYMPERILLKIWLAHKPWRCSSTWQKSGTKKLGTGENIRQPHNWKFPNLKFVEMQK